MLSLASAQATVCCSVVLLATERLYAVVSASLLFCTSLCRCVCMCVGVCYRAFVCEGVSDCVVVHPSACMRAAATVSMLYCVLARATVF